MNYWKKGLIMYVILKENDVNKLSNGTITLIGKPNEVTVFAVYVGFLCLIQIIFMST